MNAPETPAGSEHYREGWRHGYEQAAIDRERSDDAVRLVPEVVACPARDSAGAPCRRTDPHGPDSHQAHPPIAERARAMGIKPSADASEQIAALTGQPLSSPDTVQAREPGVPQVFGYILGRVTGSGVQPVESWDSRVFESEAETEAHARREGDPIGYEPLALVQVSGTDQHGRVVRPSRDTVPAPGVAAPESGC